MTRVASFWPSADKAPPESKARRSLSTDFVGIELHVMRNFELPGRSLTVARKGMAATSHAAATLAAVEALRDGGNAIDAAVTACAVQCVVEAGSTGIGGDCFVQLSRGGSADVIAYNGSGRAPMAARPEWYERQGVTTIERHSPHAVTVPGAVEAWSRLIKDHGRRPLKAALEPAIALARDGYVISPRVTHDIGKQRDLLRPRSDGETNLLDRRRRNAERGLSPAPAGTRRDAGSHRPRGPAAFYYGPIAEDMVAYLRSLGGLHTPTISRAPRAST